MAQLDRTAATPGRWDRLLTSVWQVISTVGVPLIAFIVLWQGFLFLRDTNAPKWVTAGVAIVWGVGGVAALYFIANWLIEKLPSHIRPRVLPFLFVGPAMAILAWYLVLPVFFSLVLSVENATSTAFVGLDNYAFAFSNSTMVEAIRNNVFWLVLGTGFSTGVGLLVAILAERAAFERLAKSLIFMPMAISFVGAGIIWKFVYAFKPEGADQIGLLNGIITAFGIPPQSWLTSLPANTFFLILILIWSQTGFAMVILSAALRGVPDELREAARIDGANEVQVYRRVVIPYIRGSIVTVSTTIAILTLKIFDIVITMTGGNFGTEVIATLQFKQMFQFFDNGRGSALAIILLVAVTPVVWYNLRQFGQQRGFK